MPLMDLLADWTEERSSELECYQQKPPKQKRKENKTGRKKKHNTISKDCATTTKSCNIHVMGMSEGKKGTEQKKYMKQ